MDLSYRELYLMDAQKARLRMVGLLEQQKVFLRWRVCYILHVISCVSGGRVISRMVSRG